MFSPVILPRAERLPPMHNLTEQNRLFVEQLFETLSRDGWGKGFLDALDEAVVFNPMGRSPISGRYEGKEVYDREVLRPLHDMLAKRPKLVFDTAIVENDMAAVRFHSVGGKGVNGADFSIDYFWMLKIRDAKIVEIWGYYDTGKMKDLFDPDYKQPTEN
jgi:uncharacterized protein